MSINHHYDTVAFDKRDNATMLFFARTTPGGDIDDYLLLMRADGEDFDEALYIEINEREFAGHDLIGDAQLSGNMLILKLREPAAELDGATEIVLTYDESAENKANMESGALRVLADKLSGGHA